MDANILIRAVLGVRVRTLLERYEESCEFYSPAMCLLEARQHLPQILGNRGLDAGPALTVLDEIAHLVQPIEPMLYRSFKAVACTRMAPCDVSDWPVVAFALTLDLPIWTEDRIFSAAVLPPEERPNRAFTALQAEKRGLNSSLGSAGVPAGLQTAGLPRCWVTARRPVPAIFHRSVAGVSNSTYHTVSVLTTSAAAR